MKVEPTYRHGGGGTTAPRRGVTLAEWTELFARAERAEFGRWVRSYLNLDDPPPRAPEMTPRELARVGMRMYAPLMVHPPLMTWGANL